MTSSPLTSRMSTNENAPATLATSGGRTPEENVHSHSSAVADTTRLASHLTAPVAARAAALALGFCTPDEWDSGDCDGYDRDRAYIVALAVLEAAAPPETPQHESGEDR